MHGFLVISKTNLANLVDTKHKRTQVFIQLSSVGESEQAISGQPQRSLHSYKTVRLAVLHHTTRCVRSALLGG